MSLSIFPVFKPELSSVEFKGDGNCLVSNFERLDKLAARAGLKPFSEFGDNREVPDGFDGDPDELDEILGPCDDWYAAEEGLRTMEGLVALLRSDPKRAAKLKNPDAVVEALHDLVRCLQLADKAGAKFRLEMA